VVVPAQIVTQVGDGTTVKHVEHVWPVERQVDDLSWVVRSRLASVSAIGSPQGITAPAIVAHVAVVGQADAAPWQAAWSIRRIRDIDPGRAAQLNPA
jgi:hypothetical protein